MPGGFTPGQDRRLLFNWELAMGSTKKATPRSSGPRLLAHPDSWRVIQRWAPGFATLATNHILDAGEDGLAHTLQSLSRAGFRTVGAGQMGEQLEAPLIWEAAAGRLAIVNWVFAETHPDWQSVPGPNCWPGATEAGRIIQTLKSGVDWVLVVVHWSDELFPYPRPEDRVVARELAQMGVDLIIGHHPHVVRGTEVVDSCPVFYSLGNFYFAEYRDPHAGVSIELAPRNREGLGVLVSFKRGEGPTCQVLSFWQRKDRTILDPRGRAGRRMARTSVPLQRLTEREYAGWYATRRSRFDRWDGRWQFGARRVGIRGVVRYLGQRMVRGLAEPSPVPDQAYESEF
jgi:hypothetical protein